MSVAEYRDKFAQLSRYAPNEVADDVDMHRHFLKGLYDALQLQLMSNTYPNFQTLVNRAIVIDNKRKEEASGIAQSMESWSVPSTQPEPATSTIPAAEWQSTSPAVEWLADTTLGNT